MTIFLLNDISQARVVEIFKDKIPFNMQIELGAIYQIKGEYTFNFFKEKIIKAYKIREVRMDEEFLFYLEVINERKKKKDSLFNEAEVIRANSEAACKKYNSVDIENQILKGRIFSSIFWHFLQNSHLFAETEGYITREQLLQIPELLILKSKLNQDEKFEQTLNQALQDFSSLELMVCFEGGFVFCLNIFNTFEEKFYEELIKRLNFNKQDTFGMLLVERLMNELINSQHILINKETACMFINKQIQNKKIYFSDQKKQKLSLFGFVAN